MTTTSERMAIGCPHCGKTFRPKAEAAGRKTKCPQCQETFRIPRAGESPDPTADPPLAILIGTPATVEAETVEDESQFDGVDIEIDAPIPAPALATPAIEPEPEPMPLRMPQRNYARDGWLSLGLALSKLAMALAALGLILAALWVVLLMMAAFGSGSSGNATTDAEVAGRVLAFLVGIVPGLSGVIASAMLGAIGAAGYATSRRSSEFLGWGWGVVR